MKLNRDEKRTLFAEASKFCLDIAKLIIGGCSFGKYRERGYR